MGVVGRRSHGFDHRRARHHDHDDHHHDDDHDPAIDHRTTATAHRAPQDDPAGDDLHDQAASRSGECIGRSRQVRADRRRCKTESARHVGERRVGSAQSQGYLGGASRCVLRGVRRVQRRFACSPGDVCHRRAVRAGRGRGGNRSRHVRARRRVGRHRVYSRARPWPTPRSISSQRSLVPAKR